VWSVDTRMTSRRNTKVVWRIFLGKSPPFKLPPIRSSGVLGGLSLSAADGSNSSGPVDPRVGEIRGLVRGVRMGEYTDRRNLDSF
jgi:hypothetical protein